MHRLIYRLTYRSLRFIVVSCLSLLTVSLPAVVSADGAVVSPPNYYVQETSQAAVIFYEETTTTETMVVSIGYEGTAQDFAWLIPTPQQPIVNRGSQNIFANLEALTDPYSDSYKSSDESSLLSGAYSAEPDSAVTVISEQQVAYYDVTVLTATNADELIAWFNANGYKYPVAYSYILSEYIDSGWYFTAMKIDPTVVASTAVSSNLNSGQAVPVQISFETDNMVYPLRISSIIEQPVYAYDAYDYGYVPAPLTTPSSVQNSTSVPQAHIVPVNDGYYEPYSYDTYNYQNVTLYVISDHKVQPSLSAFYLNYGNWVSRDEIMSWALDTNGNPWIEPLNDNYYLSEFSAYLYDYQMTEDVFFTPAANDDVYTQDDINGWDNDDYGEFGLIAILVGMLVFAGLVISPFGIVHTIVSIIRGKAKSRGWKIAAHVMQWVNFIVLKLIVTLVVLVTWEDTIAELPDMFNNYYYAEDAGGLVGLAIGICGFELVLFSAIIIQSIVMLVRRRRRAKVTTATAPVEPAKRRNGQRKK